MPPVDKLMPMCVSYRISLCLCEIRIYLFGLFTFAKIPDNYICKVVTKTWGSLCDCISEGSHCQKTKSILKIRLKHIIINSIEIFYYFLSLSFSAGMTVSKNSNFSKLKKCNFIDHFNLILIFRNES